MHRLHPIIYDQTVQENNWQCKLSTQAKNSSSRKNTSNMHDQSLPQFSREVFLDYLVSFIVADDQVSQNNLMFFLTLTCFQSIRVVECLEFRKLCMVLRETLLDSDIPHCDKTREAIIYRWKKSFEALKGELIVSLRILPSLSILTLINRSRVGGSVSLRTFGQTGTWHHFWH